MIIETILTILLIAVLVFLKKIWVAIDIFLSEKAKNLATKQDVSEITQMTEKVHLEFDQISKKFDADLKFKYDYYEKSFLNLYSKLYFLICQSETLRYLLKCDNKVFLFDDVPLIEYDSLNDDANSQDIDANKFYDIIEIISNNNIYASPSLIKLCCAYFNITNLNPSLENVDNIKSTTIRLKREIIVKIIQDYSNIRKILHLKDHFDESETIRTGNFFIF